jgi:vesicle-fusing ATPase
LVKNAVSYAFARNIDAGDLKSVDEKAIRVEWDDFQRALNESAPAFGNKDNEDIQTHYRNGIFNYGYEFDTIWNRLLTLVNQTRTNKRTPLMSVLLDGQTATGKTAIAAKISVESDFPYIRMISADSFIGYSESQKCGALLKTFSDSYKSSLSLIFIDDIERIIEYSPIGPRFSNTVLQTLMVLIRKV